VRVGAGDVHHTENDVEEDRSSLSKLTVHP
jgi:hypothetical protein